MARQPLKRYESTSVNVNDDLNDSDYDVTRNGKRPRCIYSFTLTSSDDLTTSSNGLDETKCVYPDQSKSTIVSEADASSSSSSSCCNGGECRNSSGSNFIKFDVRSSSFSCYNIDSNLSDSSTTVDYKDEKNNISYDKAVRLGSDNGYLPNDTDNHDCNQKPKLPPSAYFNKCLQCRKENLNPYFQYCYTCFKDQKNNILSYDKAFQLSSDNGYLPDDTNNHVCNQKPKLPPPAYFNTCLQCRKENPNPYLQYCFTCFKFRMDYFEKKPKPKQKKFRCSRSTREDSLIKDFQESHVSNSKESSFGLSKLFISHNQNNGTKDIETSQMNEYSKNICNICRKMPKNGIFNHGKIGHVYSCYPCAKKLWKKSSKCPICNVTIKFVTKIITV